MLSAWIASRLSKNGLQRLSPGEFRDLCWDDFEWLNVLGQSLDTDVENVAESLADALDRAVLRTYHGCRTVDARTYFEKGLRRHDRTELRSQILAIVGANDELGWMRGQVDNRIARIDNTIDQGRLYVAAGDKAMLERFGQYLVYGSEWISAVLGHDGRHVLREYGTPTVIEIDLPLKFLTFEVRKNLAQWMLLEWTRLTCNEPNWIAPFEFGICLQIDLPPALVVGHYHPEEVVDPLDGHITYRSPSTVCDYCRTASG
jgi:hypothetical protein